MIELEKGQACVRIAKNAAALVDALAQGPFVVNLGVGIPTRVADYVQNEHIFIHAENGMLGVGPLAAGDEVHPQLINAGRQPVTETAGCVYVDSAASFGMIRGGHVDATVLGAFEVDAQGSIANWQIPGGKQLGVGGAMDLVCGAKLVIAAMRHQNHGRPKLVGECTLPVTRRRAVDWVVTELAVFHFTREGPVLEALAPEVTPEELRAVTEMPFSLAEPLRWMVT